MNFEDVKKFFSDNKENDDVKTFLGELAKVTPEMEKEIIIKYKASDEFRKELKTEGDRRATSAVEKFQKDTMPKHVEDEIKKRFPEETPKDRRLRELEEKQLKLERDLAEKERNEILMQSLSRRKMDAKIVEFSKRLNSAANAEEFDSVFEYFSKEIQEPSVQEALKAKLPSLGIAPKNANEIPVVKKITGEEYRKLSQEDRAKARHENRIEGINLTRN